MLYGTVRLENVATVLKGELLVGFKPIKSWNRWIVGFKVKEVEGIVKVGKAGSDRHLINYWLAGKDAIDVGTLVV
jgi:hypothetical protein